MLQAIGRVALRFDPDRIAFRRRRCDGDPDVALNQPGHAWHAQAALHEPLSDRPAFNDDRVHEGPRPRFAILQVDDDQPLQHPT